MNTLKYITNPNCNFEYSENYIFCFDYDNIFVQDGLLFPDFLDEGFEKILAGGWLEQIISFEQFVAIAKQRPKKGFRLTLEDAIKQQRKLFRINL